MSAIIEIFRQGQWVPAASLQQLAADRCLLDYEVDYIFSENPEPISLTLPVGFLDAVMTSPVGGAPSERDFSVPAFLYDLVPQGRGRKHLLHLLKLADSDNLVMPLLLTGAFNPIGCLRINTAVRYFEEHIEKMAGTDAMLVNGFDLDDVMTKSADFLDHISLHAMLASGTTGVQGVAPKYLLTQDRQGQWFADLALADDLADKHWLLKLPRGRSEDDRAVLRNEAAYLRVAKACGLRVEHDPMLVGEMLFVRRFDRQVGPNGLQRLHQESLASLVGHKGFGLPTSQNELLAAMRRHVSDPLGETIEFLKRDVLNMALRNTDNHARNTAVQKLPDGVVRLTPVFDFAPMFMDPEIVPRTVHWQGARGEHRRDWPAIIEALPIPDPEKMACAKELADFAVVVAQLPDICRDQGVEPLVLERCRRSIDQNVQSLRGIQTLAT